MTDRERVYKELQRAGSRGVHSLELRFAGITGNPSQRIRELIEEGHQIETRREHRDKRPGCRYILISPTAEVGAGWNSPPLDAAASADLGGSSLGAEREENSALGDPAQLFPDRPRSAITDPEAA